MDTQKQQELIDGYLRGNLSTQDQSAFDSLFAHEPSFSARVTDALAGQVGEAPEDFVDSVASRLDNRWESIYRKGTRAVGHGLALESTVLVAALAVMVGAGWYVWKTLGSSNPAPSATTAPKVVLAFTLPSDAPSSWKPKRTFADAERDFTPRTGSRPSGSPAVALPTGNVSGGPAIGQILRIRIEVPRDLAGRVTLWDTDGQLVRKLFEGSMPKGTWALDWDQKNDRGLLVQPGSYSVHIEAGGQVLTGSVMVAPGS